MNRTDKNLLNAIAGDRTAMNQLFEQWYPRVFGLVYRYFGQQEVAKDVCQKTFIAVFKNLNSLAEPPKFKSWLFRTAINHCHMEERSRKRREKREDVWQQQKEMLAIQPDQLYRRKEKANIIAKALQKLPEEQRELILLKEYQELKFREIAELLNISENTAKSRLYYGLKSLRKILIRTDVLL